MNLNTIRFYSKAIKAGSKYVYQTVPRLLTLWLDPGEDDPELKMESNQKINQEVSKAIEVIPTYKVRPPPPDHTMLTFTSCSGSRPFLRSLRGSAMGVTKFTDCLQT
jgi:hypothetical protein